MSKKVFSDKDIKTLESNPNVKRVSKLSITYSDEFKNKFIDDYLAGKLPRQIFKENGFDIEMIGLKRIEQSAHRWKKLMKKMACLG